ncbi:glycosyltransferase family 2 protein [Candidatus Dojkabacteria bacterium]|uniref:Glycosyltransferase family 2 protein n=1 Tax=Candidatus Dojkabacteria bacterium TaxID=2099670 RepID=A0A3M0Z5E4_9BACT|nr:MAG: glycosyltransferase family 2 protein [Candidatus Dojkabacteria bacterium]
MNINYQMNLDTIYSPTVSIIMSHLTHANKYLGRCIRSILNQNVSEYEIILFDDHSTCNTESFIKEKFSKIF